MTADKILTKNKRYREWVVVPGVGSMPHAIDAEYWDEIASKTCPLCHRPIGNMTGIFLYHPRLDAAHIVCVDKDEENSISRRSNAFMIDAAAKLGGMTQDGFRALAVWEKDRLISEVMGENAQEQRAGVAGTLPPVVGL